MSSKICVFLLLSSAVAAGQVYQTGPTYPVLGTAREMRKYSEESRTSKYYDIISRSILDGAGLGKTEVGIRIYLDLGDCKGLKARKINLELETKLSKLGYVVTLRDGEYDMPDGDGSYKSCQIRGTISW